MNEIKKEKIDVIKHEPTDGGLGWWTIGIGMEVEGAPLHTFKMLASEHFSVEMIRQIVEDAIIKANRELLNYCPCCERKRPS